MSSTPSLDREILATLQDVMEDDFALLVDTFISDSGERIRSLHSSIPAKDADVIRRTAHSFKGSSSNIGAAYLAELCGLMEAQALAANLEALPLHLVEIEAEFTQVVALLKAFESTN